MGGSRFFFIESKAFEIMVDHGGGAFIVKIYERGKDVLRSVFMAKESAHRLAVVLDNLISKHHAENFVRTIHGRGKRFSSCNVIQTLKVGLSLYSQSIMVEDVAP